MCSHESRKTCICAFHPWNARGKKNEKIVKHHQIAPQNQDSYYACVMRLVGVPVGKEMATVTACPLPGIVSLHVSKVARVAGVALITVFVTMIQVLSFQLMAGAVELSTLLALFVGELNVDVLKTNDIYQARRSRCSKTQPFYPSTFLTSFFRCSISFSAVSKPSEHGVQNPCINMFSK